MESSAGTPRPRPGRRFDHPASARLIRALAGAGLAGPVLFGSTVLVQQILRRDSYHWVTQLVSDLTAGPYGWVQQINFIVLGILTMAFAAGLRLGVTPTRPGIGPAVLAVNGLGLVVAGVFPFALRPSGQVYDPIGVHTINGAIFFLTIGPVLALVGMALRRDPAWRDLTPYVWGAAVTLPALFIVIITLARPAGGPLHDWLGVIQRSALLLWLVCVVVLAARLWRVPPVTASRPPGGGLPVWTTIALAAASVATVLTVAILAVHIRNAPEPDDGIGPSPSDPVVTPPAGHNPPFPHGLGP